MSVDSIADFAELLRHGHLLEPPQLDELTLQLQDRSLEPRALAGELVRRGWLSPYQVNKLFNGRGEELVLGSYVLIERLGAGGMGEVYRARNWKLGKIVALKLIRTERLENADAVRRFQREVRAAAQLNHPNVVHAYDCDETEGRHFLVMECAEGIDLARHVKQHGPLPVSQACEYVRQAALGLQHAFERGLVHRDIKPHNLLLCRAGDGSALVKILDMGLARLGPTEDAANTTSTMTAEGMVMGTLDYIAPEQARNAHTADTRSDLYSLGCTLYFLLTGQVPFPGGTAAEKLLKHQLDQPTPIEQFRPDTPPAVAAVVRRLMAKRPEDRYATPAEAAAALTAALQDPNAVLLPPTLSEPPIAVDSAALKDTASGWSSLVTPPILTDSSSSSEQRRRDAQRRRWRFGISAAVAVAMLAGLLLLLRRGEEAPNPASQPMAAPEIKGSSIPTFEEWTAHVAELPASEQVKEVAAKLKKYNPGFDGTVKSIVEDGTVTRLELVTDHVKDLRPVKALPRLKILSCSGSRPGRGVLSDLSALKGMSLSTLVCNYNVIADLSPLEGMPLKVLHCGGNRLTDLSPLKGMELTSLACGQNPGITDLSPLSGMPLVLLGCAATGVTDLTPLSGMPLRTLTCPARLSEEDRVVLRSLKSLQHINKRPAAQFLQKNLPAPPRTSDDPQERP